MNDQGARELSMSIYVGLLLCIPIGLLFFLIARLTSCHVIGRYDRFEHRASLAFGVFGGLLIPYLWVLHLIQAALPSWPGIVLSFLSLAIEVLIIAAVFQLIGKANIHETPKEKF